MADKDIEKILDSMPGKARRLTKQKLIEENLIQQPNHGEWHVKSVDEMVPGDEYVFYGDGNKTVARFVEPQGDEVIIIERDAVKIGSQPSRLRVVPEDYGLRPYSDGSWNSTNYVEKSKGLGAE